MYPIIVSVLVGSFFDIKNFICEVENIDIGIRLIFQLETIMLRRFHLLRAGISIK